MTDNVNMNIKNTTSISNDLIKEIARSAGVDLSEDTTLEIEYRSASKGVNDGTNGGYFKYLNTHCIVIQPWAGTETLAHELRHLAQSQAFGWDELDAMYQIETELEGYEGNVFEVDAREFAKAWRV